MKRRFFALALICISLVAAVCLFACNDNDDTPILTDGMSQGDIVLALYNSSSATYTPSEDLASAWNDMPESIMNMLFGTGMNKTTKLTSKGYSQEGLTVIYEDGRLYTFDNNGYSVVEASVDTAASCAYPYCFDSTKNIEYINLLSDNFNLTVNNGVIEARSKISPTSAALFYISDLDATELDIPEQYSNYKTLELTA